MRLWAVGAGRTAPGRGRVREIHSGDVRQQFGPKRLQFLEDPLDDGSIPACTGEPLRFSDFSKNIEQDEPRLAAFYEKNPIGGHYLFRGFAKGLDAEIAQSLRATLN